MVLKPNMDKTSLSYAQSQDAADPLGHFRSYFIIPSKADLSRRTLAKNPTEPGANEPCTYLCGNSLGLQTTLASKYFKQYLETWAQKGVYGHFKEIEDSNLASWMGGDEDLQGDMAAVVGARKEEVVCMNTLTANLHLMMASFYKPTKERYKIILEGHAFPSDHYAVESQIQHHGFPVSDSMILITPPSKDSPLIPTDHIISVIDTHAATTALLMLPGIQYYTGQFLDMERITRHAQSKGIIVGWDLAHAAGNMPLRLHDWNVDFAVWCTYKYLNAGPGSMGGCFVHERYGTVTPRGSSTSSGAKTTTATTTTKTGEESPPQPKFDYHPRLTGWWGASKAARFEMNNQFEPIPGAAGYQVSNPSAADGTAVRATLDVFKQTSMADLRAKSLKLTGYLEEMLDLLAEEQRQNPELRGGSGEACFSIITPRDPGQRGVQLSVLLRPGMLDSVMETFEHEGVVLDERRPDVIRVAPTPLYNSWVDVWTFVQAFRRACEEAVKGAKGANGHA